jgi:amino acid adenylation domain-containing protein
MTDLSAEAKRELLARMLRERAAREAAARQAANDTVTPLPPGSDRPLSFGQERMWFLDQLDPGSPVYNLVFQIGLTGPLDFEALRRAVESVIARHEALRTSFPAVEGRPSQRITPPGRWDIPLTDLSMLPQEERASRARRAAELEARAPFDLANGPLLRSTLLRLDAQDHVLVLIVHHIVCDGWSLNLIFQEIAAHYRAYVANTEPAVPNLPVQYADFAAWQRRWLSGKPLEKQRAYWLEQLGGTLPTLELPTDRLPPKKRTFEGATRSVRVDSEVAQALRDLSRRQGVTLYTTLLTAFKTLLMRYSGQEDVIIGTLVAGRVRPEVESLVGFYVNTLALRTDLSGDPSFVVALERERNVVTGAQANAEFPFEKLIEELQPQRDLTRSPLFQVLINMMSFAFDKAIELPGGLSMRTLPSLDVLTVTDGLTLYAFDGQSQLDLCFVYSPELFEAQSIERMIGHFQALLASIARDPQQRLSQLSMLAPGEREQLLQASAGDAEWFPIETGYQRLFEEQVRRTPEAIAAVDDESRLSYAELNARANRVAAALIDAGVGPDQAVALSAERGTTLLTWILGTFKAGGAYLPLDPRHPPARQADVLRQSRARVVIVADALVETVERALREVPDQQIRMFRASELSAAAADERNPPVRVTPANLAYIIFTSGSTGSPKGATVPHRAMLNHFCSKVQGLALAPTDTIVQSAPMGFDISIWQMLAMLLAGGRVRFASDAVTHDPAQLFAFAQDEGATVMEIVPSVLRSYLDERPADERGQGAFGKLRWLVLGGEALTPDLCRRWFVRWPRTAMINGYGPSECADDVARHYIFEPPSEEVRTVPIGRPIHNLRVHILDRFSGLLPTGVPGELCIGGIGVGCGYLNDPQRTAAAFVPDPFGPPGALLYRTGDRARMRGDGVLEFLGRLDHQVKVRGHRIELGEIEAVLGRHAGVRQNLVTAWPSSSGDQLVAYVVPNDPGAAPTADALREHLRAVLPVYMIPSAFVLLDAFPLNANGKVNRRALPAPQLTAHSDFVAPRTAVEEQVAAIWRDLLGAERVGAHDNFFELGGHSLLAARAAARLRSAFELDIPVRMLFENQTVSELAAEIDSRLRGRAAARANTVNKDASTSGVQAILARLKSLDIRLALDGERLNVNAPKGALTPELRAELSVHKEEIKAHLRSAIGASLEESGSSPITPVPRTPLMPVSHTQQRLWFLKQMDPQNSAYNIPASMWMRGRIDIPALERTLNDLIARHESLRTRFVEVDGSPHTVIEAVSRLQIERIDLPDVPPERREEEARRVVTEFAGRPFDLGRCPLMRVALIRLAPELHVFCFVVHHIIADGLSLGILALDFHALYTAYATGSTPALPPLPVQYADYAEWDRRWLAGGALEQRLAFWKKELGGSLPVLQLPTDRPRPRVQTSNGARVFQTLDPSLLTDLKAAARSENVTLFMLLLAAFEVLLHRYTGEEDLPIGSAVANRNRPEVERVVGFFANNIVLRGNVGGDPTVRELLARVRETALGAFAHQDMPFDLLVTELGTRRDLEHSPLFQVMFVLNNGPMRKLQLPNLECEPIMFETGTARFDLAVDLFDSPEGLMVFFEYNTDLFDAGTMERMLGHYEGLLRSFIGGLGSRISELPLLPPREREQITVEWNRTALPYERQQTVHGLFEAQAARTPDAEALSFEGQSLGYAELNRRANQLAHYLRARGVTRETLVGLAMERSLEMVVAQLAILKAGGAYVPLDPGFPQDRLALMVSDAQLALIVTQASQRQIGSGSQVRRICVDTDWDEIARHPAENPAPLGGAENLAYVIYTSGSTGKPKGVQIEHRAVVNFLTSMHREPGIGPADRLLAVTTLSFDIAGLEILGPLTAGGTVVLASRATALDGYALARLIDSSGATLMQATPATWRVLLECGWTGSPGLRILCGGEGLPRELADRLLPLVSELWNMYGPTETTIWSTLARVLPGKDHPNIGRPIANTQVYILDSARQPVPVGIPGELYIGGDGVARGYLNRPELTAERFVPDPFAARADARMYRTGDLARWRPDGTIQCLGRADHQVKIRGYRIEPGEIEAALAAHPGIAQAVVVARPEPSGAQRLVAYLVPNGSATLDPAELRTFLARGLPDYMVPSIFVSLTTLPLTPNGKIDRKALPEPEMQSIATGSTYVTPANEVEAAIAAIWQEVLRVPRVGRNDNFFDLGGHSLLIVQVQNRLQKEFGRLVPIVEFFQYTTVAALAARLSSDTAGVDRMAVARERAGRRKAALRQGSAS